MLHCLTLWAVFAGPTPPPPKYISKLTLLFNFCLPILITISSWLFSCSSPLSGFSSSTLVPLQCILNPANQWNDTSVNQIMANFPMSCYLLRTTPKTYDSPQGPLWFGPRFFSPASSLSLFSSPAVLHATHFFVSLSDPLLPLYLLFPLPRMTLSPTAI